MAPVCDHAVTSADVRLASAANLKKSALTCACLSTLNFEHTPAWLYDVSMSGMFRERHDSDSTDRLVSADVLLRQQPDEEDDEEDDDRKKEDADDDDEGDGYSE